MIFSLQWLMRYTHGYDHLDEVALIANFEYTPLGALIARNTVKRTSCRLSQQTIEPQIVSLTPSVLVMQLLTLRG